MLKKYLVCAGIILLASTPWAFAADDDLTSKDGKITAGTDAEFTFQTSPQVHTIGHTTTENFVVAAAHAGSLNKPNGEAYAMSSQTSGLYKASLDDTEAIPKVPAVDAATDKDGTLGTSPYKLEGVTGGGNQGSGGNGG